MEKAALLICIPQQCEFSEGKKAFFLAWIKARDRMGLRATCVTVEASSKSHDSQLQGSPGNWN